MANKTIQQLTPLTTADASDLLALYDVSENGTNSITAANLLNTTTIAGLETTAKTIPAAINELNNELIKSILLTGTIQCTTADTSTIGYRTTGSQTIRITSLNNYPSNETILGSHVEYAWAGNPSQIAILNLTNEGYIYANSKTSSTITFGIRIYYK